MANKPIFKYSENVRVDMSHLGWPHLTGKDNTMPARIVGRGSVHVIDMWLLEFEQDFGPTYPYRVFTVPHVAIVDPTL